MTTRVAAVFPPPACPAATKLVLSFRRVRHHLLPDGIHTPLNPPSTVGYDAWVLGFILAHVLFTAYVVQVTLSSFLKINKQLGR